MKTQVRAAALLLAASLVPALSADELDNSPTGLTSPAVTLTFSEVRVNQGDSLTGQFEDYGVTFQSLFFIKGFPDIGAETGPKAVNIDINADDPVALNPYSIFFDTPQTDVAFALVTNAGDDTTITALLDGKPVDSFTSATDSTGNFFGFTNSSPFDQIQLVTANNIFGDGFIDTIELGVAESEDEPVVPEPGTWMMAVLGVAGVAVGRRFRRS
jgi:hypothetical protein